MQIKEFTLFVEALQSLPGISKKTAQRIAYYFISSDEHFYSEFTSRLTDLKYKIKQCIFCNNLTTSNVICSLCDNKMRHNNSLCIVGSVDDLNNIESSQSFVGLYFVLNGELNHRDQKSVEKIDTEKLMKMIEKFKINEILMATNMTLNGELTSAYLKNVILSNYPTIDCYRLALGIPVNSSIDYIDWESLKFSIKNKTKM